MKYIKQFEKYIDKTKYLIDYLLYFINSVASLNKPNLKKVEYLLKNGANPNIYDDNNCYGNMLSLSVYIADIKLVKLMIKYHANVNSFNSINATPLYVAAHNGYLDIVKLLVENGANIDISNDSNVSPLMTSALNNYWDVAIYLLENNADISNFNYFSYNTDYNFQKVFIEMHTSEFIKIFKDEKIHYRIKKEYSYLFDANKFNL